MSIRLRHPALADVNFVVLHDSLTYSEPFYCPSCRTLHTHKAYHLRLDSSGEVTVSDDVYERLAELPGLPLVKVGRDRFPKAQALLIGPMNAVPARLEDAVKWSIHAAGLPPVLSNGRK